MPLWHLAVTEGAKPLPRFLARRVWNGIFVAGDRRAEKGLNISAQRLEIGDCRSDREIEEICCSHFIEPGDFDRPMSVRYWEDWFEIQGGPLARAYHLLQKIDLGPERGSERGPLLEFNIGSHPGDSTHFVNAKDMLSLSLLQARLIDLKLPIKIVEGD